MSNSGKNGAAYTSAVTMEVERGTQALGMRDGCLDMRKGENPSDWIARIKKTQAAKRRKDDRPTN